MNSMMIIKIHLQEIQEPQENNLNLIKIYTYFLKIEKNKKIYLRFYFELKKLNI